MKLNVNQFHIKCRASALFCSMLGWGNCLAIKVKGKFELKMRKFILCFRSCINTNFCSPLSIFRFFLIFLINVKCFIIKKSTRTFDHPPVLALTRKISSFLTDYPHYLRQGSWDNKINTADGNITFVNAIKKPQEEKEFSLRGIFPLFLSLKCIR
jgi:hypothetical protein